MNIGVISYSLAACGFMILALLMIISWRGRPLGGLVILAAVTTAAWALFSALVASGLGKLVLPAQVAEYIRNVVWCFLMIHMVARRGNDADAVIIPRAWVYTFWLGTFSAAFFLFVVPAYFGAASEQVTDTLNQVRLIISVAMPVAGLLLVEQIFRNASAGERWAIKYFCLGVGLLFAFDFFMYADGLLYKSVSAYIWQSRGLVVSLAVPFIAVAIARNPTYDIRIHVSRNVVFYSSTIIGAGVYLLLMSLGGYLVRLTSTSYGLVLQVVFLFGAGILLCVLLFSDSIRAKIRVFLSKHFYSYKHDYRKEWLNFSGAMSRDGGGVPVRIIQALCGLMESGGGVLVEVVSNKQFTIAERWEMADMELFNARDLESLYSFLRQKEWVIDLDEYRDSPKEYPNLDLPQWFLEVPNAWLIAPLWFQSDLIGFVLIKRSGTNTHINWEDRDLLKMAGKQAAINLAQNQADRKLMEAHQFDSFNRLSAYVIHDLKNILAQQSLLLSNAEKHKTNPDFVDDVLLTIENSVARMERLMVQMREGVRGEKVSEFLLSSVLQDVVNARSAAQPTPRLAVTNDVTIKADESRLRTILSHLVQNAQEATSPSGEVSVSLAAADGAAVVEVTDDGQGMSEEFIRDRLFKPFDSTKGLAGIGIGVYESREFVRSLGGDVKVISAPGDGTTFRIFLPLE
ncbi:MAG: XrtA/PEP-CTERM system histidine kinase PrsK [bacterium]